MIVQSSPSPAERMCSRCLGVYPIEFFRNRVPGGALKMRQCNACHNQQQRDHRRQTKFKRIGRELRVAAKKIVVADTDLQVGRVVEQIVERFGGVDKVAQAWALHADAAHAERRGSKKAVDLLLGLLRMMEYAQTAQRRAYSQLSPEELRLRLDAHVLRMVREYPQIVLQAAASVGWKVEAPEGAC